jgi:hypothetical protein
LPERLLTGAFDEFGLGESKFDPAIVDRLCQCHGEPDFAAGAGNVTGFGVALGKFCVPGVFPSVCGSSVQFSLLDCAK